MLSKNVIDKFEKYSKKYKLTDKEKKEVMKTLDSKYEDAKISPGEAIGVITAESFGEPSTQMSIEFSEKVIVKINDQIKITEIGAFVDDLMKNEEPIKLHNLTEVLPLDEIEAYVPSINQQEKIEWKKIAEVSRHRYIEKLIKLTTASGRKIIATDNHSFVTRIDNEVVPVIGRDLHVGNVIPSIKYLPEHCASTLTVTEYVDFPNENDSNVTKEYRPTKLIPQELELNREFGWIVGAYLAEGNCSGGQFCLSNLDDNYINNAKKFIAKLGLGYTEDKHHRGFSDSRDFIVNSSLLARFFRNTCGGNSYNKKVPQFAYSAKEEFVLGLLKGYFDGDGNFTVDRKMIRASSNSEELIDGVKLLLTRLRIFASKSRDHKQHYLMIPYKYASIYSDKIGSDIEYKRNNLKKLFEAARRNMLSNYRDYIDMTYNFGDILKNLSKKLGLPTRDVNSATVRQRIGKTALLRHRNRFSNAAESKNIDISEELKLIDQILNSDVVWDKIEKIEYVGSTREYVYDFSVPDLETFTTFDGIITHNTLNVFHFAGVSEMQVTVGLPRLIEIFDARKRPSTPRMELRLKNKYSKTSEAVREIAMKFKETKLGDITQDISINVARANIEIVLDRKKMRGLDIKPKYIYEKIVSSMKGLDVKEGDESLILKPKNKETTLSEIYMLKEKVKNIHVRGLEGVTHVLPIKEEDKYVIHCAGSNLKSVLEIEEAETTTAMTNDIFEIGQVLGIEAAREAIIREAVKVLKDQGISVDVRHIMLLADIMTRTGEIKGITRTGITGEKESVIARATFETPIKHLINASLIGEKDELNSVVENAILNQPVPLGTGLPGLVAKMGNEEKNE